MSTFLLPAELPGLTDREAITDALYRMVLAFDHADDSLLESSLTEDVTIEFLGNTIKGIPQLKEAVYDRVSKLTTTHLLSNVRVQLESATTAKATCSSLAQHARPGKGREAGPNRYTSGGFYKADVVKVGGLWKIKYWTADLVWTEGDESVMSGQ